MADNPAIETDMSTPRNRIVRFPIIILAPHKNGAVIRKESVHEKV